MFYMHHFVSLKTTYLVASLYEYASIVLLVIFVYICSITIFKKLYMLKNYCFISCCTK